MEIIDVKAMWEEMNEADEVKFKKQDALDWDDDWDDDCCCCSGGYSK